MTILSEAAPPPQKSGFKFVLVLKLITTATNSQSSFMFEKKKSTAYCKNISTHFCACIKKVLFMGPIGVAWYLGVGKINSQS